MTAPTDSAPSAPSRRPPRRWLRWVLIGLALLLLLPLAGVAAFLLTFDPSAQRPRIEAAVRAATGRDLTLAGPVEAKLSLVPTVALTDVTLANPPDQGFSRPAMLTARRVEVELALLPLLSRQVEVRRLLLDGVDLLLERTAQGAANWVLAPAGRDATAPSPAPPPPGSGGPAEPLGISLHRLLLTDGQVAWRDGAAPPVTLGIRRFAATSDGTGTPMRLEGEVVARGLPVALKGETGPLAEVLAPAPPSRPWPLALAILAAGDAARLTLDGSVANPARGEGYRLALAAEVPDLARLAALMPDVPLPPLRGVSLAARLAADAGGAPALSEIRAQVGESDLNALVPGLRLLRLTASLPQPAAPMTLEVQARAGAVPVTLQGSLGSPMRLLAAGGGGGPFPLDLRATAGEASLTARGGIADPRALTGVDLAVAARVPGLAALAPLLPGGPALPALRDVQVQARLAERGPGFAAGAVLRDLSVASSAGDLAGDLTYVIGTRPGLAGKLASRRLDLDALAAPARGPTTAPTTTPGAAPAPAPAAPAPPPPAAAPAAPRRDGRLIPDIALPLAPLRQVDGDLRLTVAELRLGGRTWREAEAHAVIQDGKARFDPVSATLPNGAGRVTLRAGADVTADPPVVQLAARSDALDLAPLQAAFGMPARVTGRLGLDADLRGRGRDLRAVAATAHGHLGLALTGGQVPAGTLEGLGAALRNQVPGIDQVTGRPLDLSCVALRLNAQDGIARPGVLLAEGGLGRVGGGEGAGAISLRDETLALRLNSDLRLPVPGLGSGGLRIRAPLPVTGTLANPRPEWNAVVGAALAGEVANQAERLGGAGGAVAGQILGALGGALAGGGGAGGRDAAGGPIPECGPALAMARGGRPGPVPPPAAAAAPVQAPVAPPPQQQPQRPQTSPLPLPRDIPAPAQELLRRLPLPGFSR